MSAEPLENALRFFDWAESDRALLADLKPVLEKHADALVASFYRHLLSFPQTRRHLRDPEVARRLLDQQRRYLLSLAGPRVDEAYLRDRERIGEMHAERGIELRWYLGAYAFYVSLLTPLVFEHCGEDVARAEQTLAALAKLLLFDAQVAAARYMGRHEQDLEYLNQELAQSGRRLARDLERSDAALRRTAERAKAAERLASIGTLVAGLAHEIGTPMGVIQGHAKLLEKAIEGEDALWRLRTIQEQIGRISRIMQGLLHMARPSRSRRMPVALAPLLDGTLAFLTERLRRRRIEVAREFAAVPSAIGDPERLQQLFLNLFLNAADAMPKGGTLRVTLAPAPEEGEIEICVGDTGCGIAPGDLDRIFDPFFTTKTAGEGNGLGLAVAHGIVAEHHGVLKVARSDETGTVFRILLPTEPARTPPAE
jgi:signal transduction histidine kinase